MVLGAVLKTDGAHAWGSIPPPSATFRSVLMLGIGLFAKQMAPFGVRGSIPLLTAI